MNLNLRKSNAFLALAMVLGPIEEFGWRGLALPLLQRRFAPFWAGLILGIIAISLILTPFFNASKGSLLVAVLHHFQMMNPINPDAQPWDNSVASHFLAVATIGFLMKLLWVSQPGMS